MTAPSTAEKCFTWIDSISRRSVRNKKQLRDDVQLIIDGTNVLQTDEQKELFRKLVFRGSNTWDNKPTFIRKLSDLVQHGKCLFDYDRMPQREFKHTTEGIQHAKRAEGC